MPACYLLRLDPWQLSLKYSNSATELPGDSVAQFVDQMGLDKMGLDEMGINCDHDATILNL